MEVIKIDLSVKIKLNTGLISTNLIQFGNYHIPKLNFSKLGYLNCVDEYFTNLYYKIPNHSKR